MLGGSTFTNNAANGSTCGEGGAIYNDSDSLVIDSATFTTNTAQGSASDAGGGAVYAAGESVAITNTSFVSNKAVGVGGADAYGGALYEFSSDPMVIGGNSTFTNNTAQGGAGPILGGAGGDGEGGAVYTEADPGMVVANFSGNAALGGAGVGAYGGGGATVVPSTMDPSRVWSATRFWSPTARLPTIWPSEAPAAQARTVVTRKRVRSTPTLIL